MAEDSGKSSSTHLSGAREVLSPEIGVPGVLAISVGTMITEGIFVLSGVAVSNGDLRD